MESRQMATFYLHVRILFYSVAIFEVIFRGSPVVGSCALRIFSLLILALI